MSGDLFQVGYDIHVFVRTKLRSITDLIERNHKGEAVGVAEARRLISDVGVVVTDVIADLADGVETSQTMINDIETLLRKANKMCSRSKSLYDLAASERSVALLHEEIELLLQYSADDDPYLLFAGMRIHGCVKCQKNYLNVTTRVNNDKVFLHFICDVLK